MQLSQNVFQHKGAKGDPRPIKGGLILAIESHHIPLNFQVEDLHMKELESSH
jgi:hypothetical protein